jgi:hypothetical protein
MGKVRVHMTMTLDGYVAGPNQGVDAPFGEGAEHLNDWMFRLRSARALFGEEGGETGASDDVFRERAANIGATIMGRNIFGGGERLFDHVGGAGPTLEQVRVVPGTGVTHLTYRVVT